MHAFQPSASSELHAAMAAAQINYSLLRRSSYDSSANHQTGTFNNVSSSKSQRLRKQDLGSGLQSPSSHKQPAFTNRRALLI